jgi:anti-sigma28 factor (negative regulator of flagellin synthesis)
MSQLSINTNSVSRPDHTARTTVDQARRTDAPRAPERAPDRVELSEAARQAADDQSPIRIEKVRRIREQLAAGTYETDDKIAIAAHELTRELRGG